jgi:2-enoate reductase
MKEGIYPITRAVVERKIAVIGGGVGGMETARIAAVRGHKVDLYERNGELGGRLFEAGIHSFKESIRELIAWYKLQMKSANITLHMNKELSQEDIKKLDADVIIMSVGSEVLMPKSIQGIDAAKAASCTDVLDGKRKVGDNLVIVGGGLVGAEMAYDYCLDGKKVTLVEALGRLMDNDPNGVPYWVRDMLTELLERHHCNVFLNSRLESITEKGALICGKDDVRTEIRADDVIIAIGFRSRTSMIRDLMGCGKEVYEIVAGNGIGNVASQVSSAYEIARKL